MLLFSSDSAMAGIDFVNSSAVYSFLAGDHRSRDICVVVRMLGGEVGVEATKVFHIQLFTSSQQDIIFRNNRTEVMIYDGK